MLNDSKIESWKASGTYVRSSKADGIMVFAQEFGDSSAPPEQTLLLIHGFPESSFSFTL